MFRHLSDRQLHLLGMPTRNQVKFLVGWMAMSDLLGGITDAVPPTPEEIPSRQFAHWIGSLGRISGARTGSRNRKYRQDVSPNMKRKVRAS